MKQHLTKILLTILNQLTGKKFLYISKRTYEKLGLTAAMDERGVWHAGNVYQMHDISYGIAENGVVERCETKLVSDILTILQKIPGAISFYDIGANIGYYGLIAGKIFGAQVQSFEPLPRHVNALRKAVELNRLEKQVCIHNIALSDKEGQSYLIDSGSGSSLEPNFLNDPGLPTTIVQTEKLDNVISKHHLPYPTFIKIDVEGHEYAVLGGAITTIHEHQPIIFMEMCSSLENIGRNFKNNHYKDTIDILHLAGYHLYRQSDRKLEKWTTEKQYEGVAMFLCLHKNTHEVLRSHLASIGYEITP